MALVVSRLEVERCEGGRQSRWNVEYESLPRFLETTRAGMQFVRLNPCGLNLGFSI